MLQQVIDENLESLSAAELQQLLWSVDVWERAGQMPSDEAGVWRQRIVHWQQVRTTK